MGLQAAVHLGHMPRALTKEEEEEEEEHASEGWEPSKLARSVAW
jgi:hypothetical protein